MTPLSIGGFRIQRVTETEGPFAPVEFVLPTVDLAKLEAQASWVARSNSRDAVRSERHQP